MKRIISVFLAVLMLFGVNSSITAFALSDVEDYVITEKDDGTLEVTMYTGSDKTLQIVGSVDGKPVTSIGSGAFYLSTAINVTMPSKLKTIGAAAFHSSDITYLFLNDELETIEDEAFAYCTSLNGVSLPASVKSIGDNAFGSDERIKTFTVAEGNEYYYADGSALYNYDKTELLQYAVFNSADEYTVADTVSTIKTNAFCKVYYLKTLYLPSTLTKIEANAFHEASAIKDIYFDGTEEQWNAITVGKDNEALSSAEIHFKENVEINNSTSLTVGEDITSNYYIDYKGYASALNAVALRYSYNGFNEEEKYETVTSDIVSFEDISGDYYVLTFSQAAAQLAEPTKIEILDGENQVVDTINYSAKTYCDTILSMSDDEVSAFTDKVSELKTLCRSIIAYAKAAQGLFTDYMSEEGTVRITDSVGEVETQLENASEADITTDYSISNGSKIVITSASFVCTADARLRFYLDVSNSDSEDFGEPAITGFSGNSELSAKIKSTNKSGTTQYYIEVSGIDAVDFEKQMTVSYGDAAITYSVLDYAKKVLQNYSADSAEAGIAKALIVYNTNAKAFFA